MVKLFFGRFITNRGRTSNRVCTVLHRIEILIG